MKPVPLDWLCAGCFFYPKKCKGGWLDKMVTVWTTGGDYMNNGFKTLSPGCVNCDICPKYCSGVWIMEKKGKDD